MNDDPHVSGFRAGSPTPYSERLIAQAQPDLDVLPKYKKPDLEFFSVRYPYREQVDEALRWEADHSLRAEVRRYRGALANIHKIESGIDELNSLLFNAHQVRNGAVRRLEQANALERLTHANGQQLKELVAQIVERGRSS